MQCAYVYKRADRACTHSGVGLPAHRDARKEFFPCSRREHAQKRLPGGYGPKAPKQVGMEMRKSSENRMINSLGPSANCQPFFFFFLYLGVTTLPQRNNCYLEAGKHLQMKGSSGSLKLGPAGL